VPLVQTTSNEYAGNLSADGHFLTYASNETGRLELYVTQFPEGRLKWQVSSQGLSGGEPIRFSGWGHDGKTLYYIDGSGAVMAVPVESLNPFKVGAPRKIYSASAGVGEITASPDGRLLIMTPVGTQTVTPASLVVNWPSALNK
jgi:Tol biopolymer transport system component